jgi:hypothetical protein
MSSCGCKSPMGVWAPQRLLLTLDITRLAWFEPGVAFCPCSEVATTGHLITIFLLVRGCCHWNSTRGSYIAMKSGKCDLFQLLRSLDCLQWSMIELSRQLTSRLQFTITFVGQVSLDQLDLYPTALVRFHSTNSPSTRLLTTRQNLPCTHVPSQRGSHNRQLPDLDSSMTGNCLSWCRLPLLVSPIWRPLLVLTSTLLSIF